MRSELSANERETSNTQAEQSCGSAAVWSCNRKDRIIGSPLHDTSRRLKLDQQIVGAGSAPEKFIIPVTEKPNDQLAVEESALFLIGWRDNRSVHKSDDRGIILRIIRRDESSGDSSVVVHLGNRSLDGNRLRRSDRRQERRRQNKCFLHGFVTLLHKLCRVAFRQFLSDLQGVMQAVCISTVKEVYAHA
jgi:hypothetical protein